MFVEPNIRSKPINLVGTIWEHRENIKIPIYKNSISEDEIRKNYNLESADSFEDAEEFSI